MKLLINALMLFLLIVSIGCRAANGSFLSENERQRPVAGAKPGPVRIGYFHGGRCHLFYRIYIDQGFRKEEVNVRFYSKALDRADLIEIPSVHEEFIELEEKYLRPGKMTGPEILENMLKGNLEGGMIGEASFVKAATENLSITAVAALGYNRTDTPGYCLLLRKNVSINQPSDFKGKKIGVREAGPLDMILMKELFNQLGVDLKDVTIIEDMRRDQMESAFVNGEIDGGFFHFHTARGLLHQGIGYLYRKLDWLDAGSTHALLVFRNDVIKNNSDLIEKIIIAYLKRLKYEESLSEEQKIEKQDLGLMIKDDDQAMGMGIPVWDAYPVVKINLLKQIQKLMLKHKVIEKEIDLSSYIDNSYVDETYNNLYGK